MLTLIQARDRVLEGKWSDEFTDLNYIPVNERAEALHWISEHLDAELLKRSEYQAVEELMQDTMQNDAIRNSLSKMGKTFAVLQEVRMLVLHGTNEKAV